ncbi:hypothetical protein [Flammeovirga kamogawensis]|uniref:Uncharacterized protein n=1 Tax=Flammeovirga kamogawensis TaxID=373891 RepID=A0ABX8GTE3_9BACT|nr:hypothetical protein [Flammeovirga kamogawensis]MBB6460091.1 hypothetical protein [Flammeovirga kamogawensis]QWG06865.1 hypothetical protein KM029_16380 [Flammeovirga kamogawensis]TRX68687.1 hypothetical protein EO216_11375 [Flammeovirga kamogawensis]
MKVSDFISKEESGNREVKIDKVEFSLIHDGVNDNLGMLYMHVYYFINNYDEKPMCRTYKFSHLHTEDWLYYILIGGNKNIEARKWLLERMRTQYGISFLKKLK